MILDATAQQGLAEHTASLRANEKKNNRNEASEPLKFGDAVNAFSGAISS